MLGWIGTISSVIGSFLVALGIMIGGYTLFLVGAGSWLLVAWKSKNWSLLTLNGFFMVANIIGFWRNI